MGYQICLSYAFYGGHANSERNVDKTNFTAESVYNSEKNIKPFILYFVTKTHKTLFLFKMSF